MLSVKCWPFYLSLNRLTSVKSSEYHPYIIKIILKIIYQKFRSNLPGPMSWYYFPRGPFCPPPFPKENGRLWSCHHPFVDSHYNDVIMGKIGSQITSLTIVYSTVYSDADERKRQSSASLAFVRGIHRGPVNSPNKWPVTRKMLLFDDVIMSGPNFVDTITQQPLRQFTPNQVHRKPSWPVDVQCRSHLPVRLTLAYPYV